MTDTPALPSGSGYLLSALARLALLHSDDAYKAAMTAWLADIPLSWWRP